MKNHPPLKNKVVDKDLKDLLVAAKQELQHEMQDEMYKLKESIDRKLSTEFATLEAKLDEKLNTIQRWGGALLIAILTGILKLVIFGI